MPAIHAFQQSRRLRKTDEISSVFSFKRQVYGHYLKVLGKPNELGHPRLAVVVSKRNVAEAVARNYIKRTIREIFRVNQARFGAIDLVILVRKRFAAGIHQEIEKEILRLAAELNKPQTLK